MAKRPTRSQADDMTTAAPGKPRRSRASAPSTPTGADIPQPSETQAARGAIDQTAPADLSSHSEREGITSESMGSEPSEQDIRMRAYHRYLERGGGHGLDFDDWVAAERELRGNNTAR